MDQWRNPTAILGEQSNNRHPNRLIVMVKKIEGIENETINNITSNFEETHDIK
jgi:hypothetical protein